MARARNIKPGFFKNEHLAECSLAARLCFPGLWTLADREGRLEDRPKRIKGELFAFDSIEVDPLLNELALRGFIERYAVSGLALIQIVNFHKHQNPHHRESPSTLPPPPSLGLEGHGIASKPEAVDGSDDTGAQGEPEASPGLNPPDVDLARGSSRADSGFRIPDSGESARKRANPAQLRPPEVSDQVWADWLALRKAKKAPVTATVVAAARRESQKAGMTLEAFLQIWCARGSQGLEAAWLKPDERSGSGAGGRSGRTALHADDVFAGAA